MDFPERTRLALTAVWRASGRAFAALLLADADASTSGAVRVKLLITLEPAPVR